MFKRVFGALCLAIVLAIFAAGCEEPETRIQTYEEREIRSEPQMIVTE